MEQAVRRVLACGQYVLGDEGRACEREVARACGARWGVGVANGTDALMLGLQALGARYRGRPVGGLGHAGALSFYPTKNLGGYGDGGMVVSNTAAIVTRLKALRNHGATAPPESSWPCRSVRN